MEVINVNGVPKGDLIKKFATHDSDTGSSSVQIVLFTKKIREVTEHLKVNPKDHSGRRGLLRVVSRRNSMLKYLFKTNSEKYRDICKELDLRQKFTS